MTQQNSSVSDEVTETSEELAAQSEQLQTSPSIFKVNAKKAGRSEPKLVGAVQQVPSKDNVSLPGSKPQSPT